VSAAAGRLSDVELLDDYTGHVDPEGPAARRDLDAVTITKVSVGPMDNNAYVLVDKATGRTLLIDAANEADRLLDAVDTVGSRDQLRDLVTTHQHWDHVQALEAMTKELTPTTYAHPLDGPELPVAPDRTVGDDDQVRFGDSFVEVIHLDGHTPGSIALYYKDPDGTGHIFTGDSLFPGGHGKTATREHHDALMNDLERKVFSRFDDDTWVYPGHGDDTTLGAERPALPEWRERGW
jgi:glyoxylase-like metal-dependent hydrolase (beta-lactamase superfamily II)